MAVPWPRLAPLGDRGLLVEFPPEVSPEINALVRGADAALAALPGVVETVPTFRSVLVVYDPLRVRFQELVERADACARAARPAAWRSPTCLRGSILKRPRGAGTCWGGPGGSCLIPIATSPRSCGRAIRYASCRCRQKPARWPPPCERSGYRPRAAQSSRCSRVAS